MAVSLPWPQTSLTGKNSLDNRMGVPGPIRRARASKAVVHIPRATCGSRDLEPYLSVKAPRTSCNHSNAFRRVSTDAASSWFQTGPNYIEISSLVQ